MKKRILATIMAATMLCSSAIMASANPAYDRDYRFDLGALGTAVNSPVEYKIGGKTRVWFMQYSVSGVPSNTITGTWNPNID